MTDDPRRDPVCARPLAAAGSSRIGAVVFDFDGTLTRPGEIDFNSLRETVGCPRHVGLLEFLRAIPDAGERRRAIAALEEAEDAAAESCRPNEGADALVAFLRTHSIPMAIITRNRREAVERAFANLQGITAADFTPMVTRDLPFDPKPSPDSVRHVAQVLGLDVSALLVIGDHLFDIEAGRRAGALTMLLQNGAAVSGPAGRADVVVSDLHQAERVLRYGLALPARSYTLEAGEGRSTV